uniref:Integrase catalytic domain-containing protein n=1 Tax=Parastrongyloides trichosuri TaxID=131310 RepID=A0A0N4Z885_PARTI
MDNAMEADAMRMDIVEGLTDNVTDKKVIEEGVGNDVVSHDWVEFSEQLFGKEVSIMEEAVFKKLVKITHEEIGHLSANYVSATLLKRVYEKMLPGNFRRLIRQVIDGCERCLEFNRRLYKRDWDNKMEMPQRPLQNWATDVLGPLEEHGEKFHILVTTDMYSRMVWLGKLKDATSRSIIKCFKKLFGEAEKPAVLRVDNARYFTSKEFQLFLKEELVQHSTAVPMHHNGNCVAERLIEKVGLMLSNEERPMSLAIQRVAKKVNLGERLDDVLPYEAHYGQPPRLVVDYLRDYQKNWVAKKRLDL